MLKKLFITILFDSLYSITSFAEMIPLQKDFDINTIKCKQTTAITNYTDSELEVNVLNPIFQSFEKSDKPFSLYSKMNNNEIKQFFRHSDLTTVGTDYLYHVCIGANFRFKNKTSTPIFIDLNNSVVSIGSYYGKPLIENIRFSESLPSNLPPLIIMPNQVIEKTLYRNDYVFYKPASVLDFSSIGWVIRKEDLYLEKNIFGVGNFLFTIGVNEKRIIPMQFHLEIDEQSILPFIDSKKQESIDKFKIKMAKKYNKK